MNFNISKILMASIIVAGMTSCDDTWSPKLDKEGSLRLSSMGVTVSEESRSGDTQNVDNFLVEIMQGETLVAGPYAYSAMPEVVTLNVGEYNLKVRSHEVEKAQWDAPYFYGTKSFAITEGKITDAGSVTCYFSNIAVTILYTEDLYKAMGDDCKVTVIANDEGTLIFTKSEIRSGYFEALEGSNTLVATFTGTVDGNKRTLSQTYTDAKPGQHYTITYSLQNGNPTIPTPGTTPEEGGSIDPAEGAGSGISLNIVTDTEVPTTLDITYDPGSNEEVIIPVVRPSEEPEDPEDPNTPTDPNPGTDDPTVQLFSVTSANPDVFFIDEDNIVKEGTPYIAVLHSENPLENLWIDIDSEVLTEDDLNEVGLKKKFDLAHPGELEAALTGLQLKTGDEILGKNDLNFDISGLVPLLSMLGSGTSYFTLTMIDNQGNEFSKTLTFIVP